jgi:glycolate oxidase iron-sulfur subunit
VNELRDDMARCTRCGDCREVCPVFALTRVETDVARGRVLRLEAAVARERFTAADRDALSRCLLCGRCTEVCKAQLDLPRLMQAAKVQAGAARGLSDILTGATLADAARLNRAARGYRQLARWLGRATPDGSGLRLRFSMPYVEADRLLPQPPPVSYLERHAGRPAKGRAKIALFAGCGAGRLFEGVATAVDAVLAELELQAAVPDQACCGLPAWGIGADDAARRVAAAWVEAFSGDDFEAILSPCASCTAHLQQTLPTMLAGTPLATQAGTLAATVEDFFAWLARRPVSFDLAGVRVALHVPCHARRGVRDGEAVRRVLVDAGAELVQLPPALERQCCGMGGTFGVRHPHDSRAIGLPKVRAMLDAAPHVIVTTCTGCVLQLRDLVAFLGAPVAVKHAIKLVTPY